MGLQLVIGNKTYSSWSMRPWLVLKHFEIPFEEILVKLDQPDTRQEILKYSPSAKVPALIDDGFLVWESMAIIDYLAEKFPDKKIYPDEMKSRTRMRSLCLEMHSGFAAMREHLSFHAKKHFPNFDTSKAQKDIERVKEIWSECLENSKGPFLFGEFGAIDAMFAPVVGRFKTYDVSLKGPLLEYSNKVMILPAVREWYTGALQENFIAEDHE